MLAVATSGEKNNANHSPLIAFLYPCRLFYVHKNRDCNQNTVPRILGTKDSSHCFQGSN